MFTFKTYQLFLSLFLKEQCMRNDYLRIIFYKRLSKYSTDTAQINGTFDKLLKAYQSEKRYYHDLTHIISLLKLFEEHHGALLDKDVVYLAIWFHDAVFDAWKSDNEEQSAEWAKEFLTTIGFPNAKADKVVNFILATKTHESNGDGDMNYFLDFDLSILSADDTIYDVYTKQIRDEYSFYPSFLYNRGRRKILQNFLNKNHIYKTDVFYGKNEAKARENIQRELDNL
jgi:predicted metal-dependent HD superfamily phosphohydrolase